MPNGKYLAVFDTGDRLAYTSLKLELCTHTLFGIFDMKHVATDGPPARNKDSHILYYARGVMWVAALIFSLFIALYWSGFIKLYEDSDLLSDLRDGAYPEHSETINESLRVLSDAGISSIEPAGSDMGDRYRVEGLDRALVVKVRSASVSDYMRQPPLFKLRLNDAAPSLRVHDPDEAPTKELYSMLSRVLDRIADEVSES